MPFDTSRQWPTCFSEASQHHLARYDFASRHVFGRVLDAACGSGYGSSILNTLHPSVVGVDQYKKALIWAREFYPGPTYILGKIEDLPWKGNFDSVVSVETIEHLENPVPVLKVFREVCLGMFVVSVPNELKYPFNKEHFSQDEFPHFRHYTPDEFEKTLNDAGFSVTGRFSQLSKEQAEVVKGTDGKFLVYLCK